MVDVFGGGRESVKGPRGPPGPRGAAGRSGSFNDLCMWMPQSDWSTRMDPHNEREQ